MSCEHEVLIAISSNIGTGLIIGYLYYWKNRRDMARLDKILPRAGDVAPSPQTLIKNP